MAYLAGKLTKNLVRTLGSGRHGDGNGLYLVVDPSGARRWIVRVTVKGQRNRQGKPLRTDFGLGGADVVTLNVARERALTALTARVLIEVMGRKADIGTTKPVTIAGIRTESCCQEARIAKNAIGFKML